MPMYSFECPKKKCVGVFDEVRPMNESQTPIPCPKCKSESKRVITFRNSEPTFTEILYPFYHQGIGEVVNSPAHLNKRCKDLGYVSHHEGASMSARQEKMLLSKRTAANPREIREKVRWSGRGVGLPTLETFE